MYRFDLGIQPTDSCVAEIGAMAERENWSELFVSVAYATTSGCLQLVGELNERWPGFEGARKLIAVGLDFGLTEPAAIQYLADLPRSSVRIFEPEATLRARLRPPQRFHPKLYAFLRPGRRVATSRAAGVVGSANLTGSGLTSNTEAFASFDVSGSMQDGREWLAKLQAARRSARLLPEVSSNLLRRYSAARRRLPRPTGGQEPPPNVRPPQDDLSPEILRALSSARFLWTQTLQIVENRGADRAGNQVDLKKGMRWFFRLPVDLDSPPNTALGTIEIRFGDRRETCNLRYGNNGMDKVNLPVPEGAASYEHSYLLWKRLSPGRYSLVVRKTGRALRSASLVEGSLFKYSGGQREWGFFNDPAAAT